jgi:1-aminocyclopropane-1-carboxylate deaminase
MNQKLHHLTSCLAAIPQIDYPTHSRIHPLRSFIFPSVQCYVKRDDELGFGISGSKIRKYRSLIPFLLAKQVQEVVVIGSAYSNHVLSFVQLMIENGLQPTLFLRGDPSRSLQGNALLTSLFVLPSAIHWLSQSDWKNVESLAYLYASKQNHSTFVLPEGAFCSQLCQGL